MEDLKDKSEKWVEVTIPMPEVTWNSLRKKAAKEGCSVSTIVKKSIINQNRKRPIEKEEVWSDIDDVTETNLLV